MALDYPGFAELNAARVTALKELLTAVLLDYNPDLDLRRGVISDLVLSPRALLGATIEQAVLKALETTSLSGIIADPEAADADAVDRVLGNFRLVRRPAAKATGVIAIVLNRLVATTIPAGSSFTANGQIFVTTATYRGRIAEGEVIADTDRLITAVTGGNYLLSIDVEARTAGAAGNVSRAAAVTPAAPPFALVRAYTDSSFAGGADAESNVSLLDRLDSGLALRAWGGPASIEAASRSAVPDLLNVSVIGHGDAEMLRGQHGLWPVAGGGRADLYARTDLLYQTVRLRKTATLISAAGSVGTWQLGLGRDDAPGFYEIEAITPPSGDPAVSSFAIASETRSIDLSGEAAPPDLIDGIEGYFSAYQAATVQFVDTATDATALVLGTSQADYDVIVRAMPSLRTLQDFWLDPDNAPTSGDVLVKAPVPCFVAMAVTLTVPAGVTVDETAVEAVLADAVNRLRFPGTLALSYINKLLHEAVPEMTMASGYSITGRILAPGGGVIHLAGSGDLTIPDSPEVMVTPSTVAFFLAAEDVTLTLVTA